MTRTGVIAWCRFRIHSKLRHQPGADVVVVEVTANAELFQLNFVGAKQLTRTAHGMICGMVEVRDIVGVGSDLWGKEFRVPKYIFCARVPVQPSPIRIRKRLDRFLRLACGCTRRCCRRLVLLGLDGRRGGGLNETRKSTLSSSKYA
jgi:hypothetical protein